MGGHREVRLEIPRSLGEAMAVQELIAREAGAAPPVALDRVRRIAGADASYSPDGRFVHAAVAVLGLPDLAVLESRWASREVHLSYLPGFLAFREGPAILSAFGALGTEPDLLLVDGHGRAHPRRAGIATHLGLLLGIPSIGVAKRILTGSAAEPGPERGEVSPILDEGEILGMAVRPKEGARPVYVSPGYAMDPETAVKAVLSTTPDSRLPAPLREAHRISREVRQSFDPSPAGI